MSWTRWADKMLWALIGIALVQGHWVTACGLILVSGVLAYVLGDADESGRPAAPDDPKRNGHRA